MPGQLRPGRVVVVLVAVMNGDPGEGGQDPELSERGQVPTTQVQGGVVLGGGRQDVAFVPGRTDAQGRLVEPDHICQSDQRLISVTVGRTAAAHRVSMDCTNPLDGPAPPVRSPINSTQRPTGTCW